MLRRRIGSVMVPTIVAVLSFLHVRATGALVTARAAPAAIAPFAEQAALGADPTSEHPGPLVYVVVKDTKSIQLESVTR